MSCERSMVATPLAEPSADKFFSAIRQKKHPHGRGEDSFGT
jgi:hypothetical protein